MSLLKRVFSADYRRALAAEAAGEYAEAARSYALSGEDAKVAEMHLLAAERAGRPDGRLAQLLLATRWCERGASEALAVRRRVARALFEHVRDAGVLSESDRKLLRQAARLFASAGDHVGAGECLELAGDEQAAADAYQHGGEVERLESVLAREERRREVGHRVRETFAEYQVHLRAGARDEAARRLRECVQLEPGGPARRLLDELESRLITSGSAALRTETAHTPTLYVGAFPFGIGREHTAEMALRDARVSRRHAEILWRAPRFFLRDCQSRNGTFLAGLRIDGELPLEAEGEIGIGDAVSLSFRVEGPLLRLQVVRGIDRGLEAIASVMPIPLEGGAALLRFRDGRPFLEPGPGRRLILDGARVGTGVQLVRGDRVAAQLEGQPTEAACFVVEAP